MKGIIMPLKVEIAYPTGYNEEYRGLQGIIHSISDDGWFLAQPDTARYDVLVLKYNKVVRCQRSELVPVTEEVESNQPESAETAIDTSSPPNEQEPAVKQVKGPYLIATSKEERAEFMSWCIDEMRRYSSMIKSYHSAVDALLWEISGQHTYLMAQGLKQPISSIIYNLRLESEYINRLVVIIACGVDGIATIEDNEINYWWDLWQHGQKTQLKGN
jgi:hypothetical protein